MSTRRHIGILEFAKEFAEAASCFVDMQAPIAKLPWPTYFLWGRAIELALKSALKLGGTDDKSLKRIGHEAFSNPRMSLKSVRVEKGRLQGENLLSERIEMFERGGGQGGGGS